MWKWVIADFVVAFFGTILYGLTKENYPRIGKTVAVVGGLAILALPVLIIVALFVGGEA
jgi:hypothetical protein